MFLVSGSGQAAALRGNWGAGGCSSGGIKPRSATANQAHTCPLTQCRPSAGDHTCGGEGACKEDTRHRLSSQNQSYTSNCCHTSRTPHLKKCFRVFHLQDKTGPVARIKNDLKTFHSHFRNQSDSSAGRAFGLQMASPGLTLDTPNGPLRTTKSDPGVHSQE